LLDIYSIFKYLSFYFATYETGSIELWGPFLFRRCAATWCSKVGLLDSEIKLLGYWSSDCFSRYVDSDVDQRLKAISTFSSLLPH
jgi:hypothetical protein